jgi:hypothetical protein
MVDILVLRKRFVDGRPSLAKQDVVVPDVKAGHTGIAKASQRLETEQIAVKLFRLRQIVHRYGPMRNSLDFE